MPIDQDRFQSLFCWTINSKKEKMNENIERNRFQSLFCWTINSKTLIFFDVNEKIEFQSLFCWTINSKAGYYENSSITSNVSILVLLDN